MPGMQPEEPKSKLPLIIGGIAGVLVLILIGVGAYFFLSGDEEEDPDSGLHLHQCDGPTRTTARRTRSRRVCYQLCPDRCAEPRRLPRERPVLG